MRRALALGLTSIGLVAVTGVAVLAQQTTTGANQASGAQAASGQDQGASAAPPGVPIIQAPPEVETQPANVAAAPPHAHAATNSVASNSLAAAKPPPPPPAMPVRSPAAIVQALDKVTAETMRFAAPVGQRVRYKNLVFTVKTCETSGLGTPEPQASAYVVIDSAPIPTEGVAAQPPKEVFHGWMFANSPALDPFQHPIYDAWLIACMASAPAA